MIKIATVCSGIGSPEQAIKDLQLKHEVVFGCEIDKYARASYKAIHGDLKVYEDMTIESWDTKEQYSDLFIGGIPCQAFSLAGKRLGELDPRGLLFFDFYRYVKKQQPKVFIIENVKGLLSDNKGKTFQNWLLLLGNSVNGHSQMFNHPDSLEYNLHYTVLNSKNFGVPQNRERVFIIGIRKDLPNSFRFPIGYKLDKRLKDVLEPIVDEKYYLTDTCISRLTNNNEGYHSEIRDENSIASTILASDYKLARGMNVLRINEATKQGFAIAKPGDSINLSNPNSETRRGRVGNQIANTLDTACNQAVVEQVVQLNPSKESGGKQPYQQNRLYDSNCLSPTIDTGAGRWSVTGNRIRRLTPLECWRLQAFPDEAFYKAKEVNSDTQLYKQAGNSITTTVIKAIINNVATLLHST